MEKPGTIGIALSARETAHRIFESCKRVFDRHHVQCIVEKKLDWVHLHKKKEFLHSDIIIVFGGDGSFLKVCQTVQTNTPLFLVGCGEKNQLSSIDAQNAPKQIEQILLGQYRVTKRTRLKTNWPAAPLALNEIVIVPQTSATLMHYELAVWNQLVWHDYSDGVIVCTPTGSRAYFESAGGIHIDPDAPVIGIASINSLKEKKRAVFSNQKPVLIQRISCLHPVELVMDGQQRFKIKDEIYIRTARQPVWLGFPLRLALHKTSVEQLTPSARFVLSILQQKGSSTQQELARETGFSTRSIRRALIELENQKKIVKRPYSKDQRQDLYHHV